MKRQISFLLTIFITQFCISDSLIAQNLCPNPGFEQLTGCPTGAGEIMLASPWSGAGAPADLFSSCHINSIPAGCSNVSVPANFAGQSTAQSGSNYSGFYTKKSVANNRNYIRSPLNSPLISGQLYKISAYFRRSQNSGFATNNIGIAISTSALVQTGNNVINIAPQVEVPGVIADSGTWTSFTGFYTAAGGEAHITLGNFKNDANTSSFNFTITTPACIDMQSSAFYYVDNVTVTPVTEQISVTGDTIVCIGDSTLLTGITNTSGWWSLASSPNDTIPSVNNSISVTPSVNTSFLWNGIQTSYTVTVSVVSRPTITLPMDTTICQRETYILDATTPGCTYTWSTGESTAVIAVADSGSYVITVDNGYCADRDTFNLEVIPTPDIQIPSSAVICPDNGETIFLDAGTGDQFLWTPDGDTTGSITVNIAGIYQVTVTHGSGCTRTATTEVIETCRETLFIPGAFTPNKDGKNDLFFAEGTGIETYSIIIFNRWGQPVFETDRLGISGAWDGDFEGQPASAGSYAFTVKYEAIQSTGKKKRFIRNGTINLIR